MTLTQDQITEYRTLKDSGVDVSKHNQIRFNSGSETVKHLVAKTIAGHLGRVNCYRVDSEVTVENGGVYEIDVLLWGHPDRLTLAVEIETSPTEGVKSQKLNQYVRGTAVDDMILINCTDLKIDMLTMACQISDTLGLDL